MAENKEELLRHYRQTRDELMSVIAGLSDEQMSDPSLDGWSVNDHLTHVALWDDLRATEVERISAGHESAWKFTGDQDDAYNEVGHALRRGMSAAQAKWELERSRQRLLDAISDAKPRGLDASLYGSAGLVSSHEVEHSGWIKRWRSEKGI
jgi:uncharacterized damage-inducible protein DinB